MNEMQVTAWTYLCIGNSHSSTRDDMGIVFKSEAIQIDFERPLIAEGSQNLMQNEHHSPLYCRAQHGIR